MTPKTPRMALWAWIAAVLTSLWLGGCGPGVGGTGTDSVAEALAQFGAQSAGGCPVCAPAGTATGGPSTPLVFQSVSGSATPLLVTYLERSVALEERCTRWRFIGEWGSTPAGNGRYYGLYLAPGQTVGEVAALSVAVAADGRQTLTLRDLFDRTLQGPVTVEPATAAGISVRCP